METQTLKIKHMVCPRCVRAVERLLHEAGATVLSVTLGEARVQFPDPAGQLPVVRQLLSDEGFELLEDQKAALASAVKDHIVGLVNGGGLAEMRTNLSTGLAAALEKEYTYLSHLFSAVEGITIEKFFILCKIEKAKELLAYGEGPLAAIAHELGYSSSAHLSAQFKQVTGMTPGHFRKEAAPDRTVPGRKPLDRGCQKTGLRPGAAPGAGCGLLNHQLYAQLFAAHHHSGIVKTGGQGLAEVELLHRAEGQGPLGHQPAGGIIHLQPPFCRAPGQVAAQEKRE